MRCECPRCSHRLLSSGAIALVLCVWLAACGSGHSNSAPSTGSNPGSPSSNPTAPGGNPGTPTSGPGGTGTNGTGGGQGTSSPVIYVSETAQNLNNGNAAGAFSGIIEAFALKVSSGALSPISGSPFSTKYSTGGDLALAPNGAFAYVLAQSYPVGTRCIGPFSLLVYTLDPASGAPTLKQALATGSSQVGTISVDPFGHFIYLTPYTDSSGNTGIGIFSVQSDNTVAFTSFIQVQSQGDAAITPDGKFLYTHSDGTPVGNLGNNPCGPFNSNIWAFSINSTTGALSPVAGSPVVFQRQVCEVGHAPQYITKQIDSAGKRLFGR